MPCPYFKGGKCTSPLLGSLTTDMYERGKCDGEGYKNCRYYKGATASLGTEAFVEKKPDPLLNIMEKPPKEGCPLMKTIRIERGYAVYCEGFGRFLTRFEISLCEQDHNRCPIRKLIMEQGTL
jgi:hypothetical protein|uniref:Uncharacterized protein n=1 Tax=Fervidicoccus fontis TaxID=683846 RepID=A0A7J3SLI4_9CREN